MNPEFENLRKEYEGKSAFIIGGGPSVSSFPLSPLCGRFVISINNAHQFPCTSVLWFGDLPWYEWNEQKLKSFTKPKITCHPAFNNKPGFIVFKRGKPQGIETRQGQVSWNTCSGGSAINLAWHLKVKRAILIGFDMTRDAQGNANFHNEHKRRGKPPYSVYMDSFEKIALDARAMGFEILNANPESKMDYFPKISTEEALNYGL